jgi:peptidoglycan/LPS O-acetylase OafA/YrhL
MTVTDEKPNARPMFRRLALGMAVVCFVLGAVFGIAQGDDSLFTMLVCLFVGFVMLTIARTGRWPPPREG